MVKDCVTKEERKEIFKRDKEISAKKLKEQKKRRNMQQRMTRTKERAQRQLEIFRAQLHSPTEHLAVIPGSRVDRNMHKRLYGPPTTELEDSRGRLPSETTVGERRAFDRLGSKGLSKSSVPDGVEAMEVDPSPKGEGVRGVKAKEDWDVIKREEKLAEEFEWQEDYDFGFDLV